MAWRRDPFGNFNFKVLFGAIGGLAALGIVGRLITRARRRSPGVYIEEVPAGPRPIGGVGTTTAGFVGMAPRQAKRQPAATRPRKGRARKGPAKKA